MKDEKKQEKMSLEEQMKLYVKLAKEGRLHEDTDRIYRDNFPRKPEHKG